MFPSAEDNDRGYSHTHNVYCTHVHALRRWHYRQDKLRYPKLACVLYSVRVYHNCVNVGEGVWGGVGYVVRRWCCVDWRGLTIRLVTTKEIINTATCKVSLHSTLCCGRLALTFFPLLRAPSSSVLVALTLTSSGNGRNTATLHIERGIYIHVHYCVHCLSCMQGQWKQISIGLANHSTYIACKFYKEGGAR